MSQSNNNWKKTSDDEQQPIIASNNQQIIYINHDDDDDDESMMTNNHENDAATTTTMRVQISDNQQQQQLDSASTMMTDVDPTPISPLYPTIVGQQQQQNVQQQQPYYPLFLGSYVNVNHSSHSGGAPVQLSQPQLEQNYYSDFSSYRNLPDVTDRTQQSIISSESFAIDSSSLLPVNYQPNSQLPNLTIGTSVAAAAVDGGYHSIDKGEKSPATDISKLKTVKWTFHCHVPAVALHNLDRPRVELVCTFSSKKNKRDIRLSYRFKEHDEYTSHYIAHVDVPVHTSVLTYCVQVVEVSGMAKPDRNRKVIMHDGSADQYRNHVYFVHSDYAPSSRGLISIFGSSMEDTPFTLFLKSAINDSLVHFMTISASSTTEKQAVELFVAQYECLLWCSLNLEIPNRASLPELRTNRTANAISPRFRDEMWQALVSFLSSKQYIRSFIFVAEAMILWGIVSHLSQLDTSKLNGRDKLLMLLKSCDFDSIRKIRKLVPTQFVDQFNSGIRNVFELSASQDAFQWIKFAPYIIEENEFRLGYESLYEHLKSFSRSMSMRQKVESFKKTVLHLKEKLVGLTINRSDLSLLIETMLDICPNVKCCYSVYGFATLFNEGEGIFVNMFANYLKSCDRENLTLKRLQRLVSFLNENPRLYQTTLVISILLNRQIVSCDESHAKLVLSIVQSYLVHSRCERDVSLIADAVDTYLSNLFNELKGSKQKKLADDKKVLSFAVGIYQTLLLYVHGTIMAGQSDYFMRKLEENTFIFSQHNPSKVLDSILSVNSMNVDSLIIDVLSRRASGFCRTLLISDREDIRAKLVQQVLDRCSRSNKTDNIGASVLNEIISSMPNFASMDSIIYYQRVWSFILQYPWRSTAIEGQCVLVTQTIEKIAKKIENSTVLYDELKCICQDSRRERFIQLIHSTHVKNITDGQLKQFNSEVAQYEATLTDIRSYINNYGCHSNVDYSQLEGVLEKIEKNVNVMPFLKLSRLLLELPIYSRVKVLRKLGDNDLFLRMYEHLVNKHWNSNRAQRSESVNYAELGESVQEEIDSNQQKLSLSYVVDRVIPELESEWVTLYREIDNRSISFKKLQDSFEGLPSDRLFHTLSLLKETCIRESGTSYVVSITNVDKGDAWVQQRFKEISGFIYILGQRAILPQIINVVHLFKKSFQLSSNDGFYQNITWLEDYLQSNWQDGVLERVSHVVEPARKVLSTFSQADLSLVSALNGCDNMLEWLFEERDNNNFNEKIRVARSINDDAILLQSFASLTETRQYLFPLLYPSSQFLSAESFFGTLNALNKSITDIDDKIKHIAVTRTNLDLIKESLARVNASPGVQACLQVKKIHDKGKFIIDSNSRNQVCCCVDTNSRSLEDLIDLQTTLLNVKIPDEFKESHSDIDSIVNDFVTSVQTLSRLHSSLQELCSNAHLEYSYYTKEFSVATDLIHIQNEAEYLKQESVRWVDSIQKIRDSHYFINYFSMKQIKMIVQSFDGTNYQELLSLMMMVDRSVDEQVAQLVVLTYVARCSLFVNNLKAEDRLKLLAQTFDEIFSERVTQLGTRKPFKHEADPDVMDEESIKHLSIIGCEETDIPNVIFSLYVQERRLPEPDEILMCYEETRFEDVLLLLRRWSKARQYGLSSRVYVIAGIHRLSYSVQCTVVDALKPMLHSELSSSLYLLGDKIDRQRLANAFSTYIAETNILLPHEDLVKHYISVFNSEYSGDIAGVRSNICGGGKTNYILGQCYDSNRVYYRVSLREDIQMNSLIESFESAKSREVVFHVDVSPSVSKMANYVLFELLIVGTLQDRVTGRVYHKSAEDSFYVEVPNTPGNRCLKQVLTLCDSLPSRSIIVSPQCMDIYTYSVPHNLSKVEQRKNFQLQFVCKHLDAYKQGVFSDAGLQKSWDPDSVPDIPPHQCYETLVSASQTQQPSFALLNNFVKFTYPQFKSLRSFSFLNFLCEDPDWREIKTIIIQIILETARDFAVRQIALNFSHDPSLEEYTERFKTLKKWNESKHPVLVFIESMDYETCGLNLISLDPSLIDRFMPKPLQDMVQQNGIDLKFNFHQSVLQIGQLETEAKCLEKLKMVAGQMSGMDEGMREFSNLMIREVLQNTDYVLTEDNLMKMFAIVMRFERGLPVIITGETGCGKSFLVQYLCRVLEYNLSKIVIHGGHSDEDIFQFVRGVKEKAMLAQEATFVVFLDEVNTTNSLGAIKEIVCDRFMDGVVLPPNIKIVCALNPYRKRQAPITEEAGLIFKHAAVQSLPDPLESLAYRVFPIPDTFAESLFDFGQIDNATECHYVNSMLRKGLNTSANAPSMTNIVIHFVTEMLFSSQSFIRDITKEISSVSLRDIDRAVRLFKWFDLMRPVESIIDLQNGVIRERDCNARVARLIILTLGHVYYTRLSRKDRSSYLQYIGGKSAQHGARWYLSPQKFEALLAAEQKELTEKMNPGSGIALNEALCENVFMIVTSAINRIPIFIIGLPGASKSLAIDLIAKAMKGKSSADDFLKNLPSFDVFTHQCSPLSTASGIEKSFRSAGTYAKDAKNSLVVLVLDEIGLAEQSPFMPLKVLHQELERKDIATVAISNFSLDAAKMNRAVFLLRSPPTRDQLESTAQGIVSNRVLKNNLKSLADSYQQVYDNQKMKNFFGLREYYYLVKYIDARVKNGLTPDILLNAVMRNFGGRDEQETLEILKTFSSKSMNLMHLERPSNRLLIEENLKDLKARHLMLLTQNNAALNLLFDFKILDSISDVELIFGTDFPADKTNFNISLDLQRIKLAMASGRIVVLVHADSLYESLYDLLNQHYVQVQNLKYARLAFGCSSVTCPVHDNFRIIVISELKDVEKLSAPFLNRLEKQVLLRDHLLTEEQRNLVNRLSQFVEKLKSDSGLDSDELFIGSHGSTLTSLVQSMDGVTDNDILADLDMFHVSEDGVEDNEQFDLACNRLIYTMTPESVLTTRNIDLIDNYFKKQVHSDLNSLLDRCLNNYHGMDCKDTGIQLVVNTHSPLDIELETSLATLTQKRGIDLCFLQLHEMQSSLDLTRACDEFLNSEAEEALLVLLCDPNGTSLRRIRFAQYELESRKNKCTNGRIRHIALVIMIMRTTKVVYTFDFDKRWRYVYIDDVRTIKTDLPSTTDMISNSLSVVIEQKIDIIGVLYNNIHHALSRIIYPNRTKQQIQQQVKILKLWLRSRGDFETRFSNSVRALIIDFVKHSKALDQDEQWFINVATNVKELYVCGTFRSALHQYIQKVCYLTFSSLISHIDRNGNLAILANGSYQEKNLWLQILPSVARVRVIEATYQQLLTHNFIEVKHDEKSGHLQALFPFSHRIGRYIESSKFSVDSNNPTLVRQSIEKQLKLSYSILLEPQTPKLIVNYLSDYQMMFGRSSLNIDLVLQILTLYLGEESVLSIPAVQTAFWACEKRLHVVNTLLTCVPEIAEEYALALSNSENLLYADTELCRLCLTLLNPKVFANDNDLETIDDFKSWIHRISNIRTAMNLVLSREWMGLTSSYNQDDIETDSLVLARTKLSRSWKKILFYSQFIRELALPGQLPQPICLKFWEDLNVNEEDVFQNANSLSAMITLLRSTNQQHSRNGDEYECDICYDIPKRPVNTKCCQRSVCYDCAVKYLENSKDSTCFHCRKEINRDSLEEYIDECSDQFQEDVECAKSKEEEFKKYSSRIVEVFLVDYCLSIDNSELSDDLIRNIIKYIGEDQDLDPTMSFITSDSLISSVIRRLLRMYMSNQSVDVIKKELNRQLKRYYGVNRNVEFRLATCICQNFEDYCEERAILSKEKLDLALNNIPQDKILDVDNLFETLYSIAYARFVISRLVQQLLDISSESMIDQDLISAADRFMIKSHDTLIFFLRELVKHGGMSYAKQMLSSPSISEMQSLKDWFADNPQIHRLLSSSNVVESSSPFLTLYPDMNKVVEAVDTLLLTNDDTLLNEIMLHPQDIQKTKAYLLISIMEGVYIARAYSSSINTEVITNWMKQHSRVNWLNEELFPLLKLFMNSRIHGSLVLNEQSSLNDVWLLRCVIHWVALILQLGVAEGGLLYKLLMKTPSVRDGYLPAMPDDCRQMIANVLLGGTFYTCPNNHQYFVDNCGKPMEVLKCPYCKSDIGGTDHKMLPDNKLIGTRDDQSQLYCLQDVSLEGDVMCIARNLKPKQLRTLRFMLHAILLIGNLLSGGCKNVFNEQSPKPADSVQFFVDHLLNDWNLLSKITEQNFEHTSIILHLAALELLKFLQNDTNQTRLLKTQQQRQGFEDGFSNAVNDMFNSNSSISEAIEDFMKKHENNERDNTVAVEILLERNVSSVWMHNEHISFDRFALKMAELNPSEASLARLFASKQEQLYSTRYIHDILQMFSHVFSRFNKKITRQFAQEKSVMDIINELPQSQRKDVYDVWQRFKKAWNISWKFVKHYGCLQIPANMHHFEMTDDTKLIFILPNESDECLFSLAFIDHLFTVHNEFVNLISTVRALGEEYPTETVSSIDLTKANLVSYSLKKQIVPFLKDHCNRPLLLSECNPISYDVHYFEQYLIDQIFNGKPIIQAEIRLFEFVGDLRKTDARSRLAARVQQEKLDDHTKRELTQGFDTTEKCSQCFRMIEVAINFIQTTGGSSLEQLEDNTAEIYIIDYLTDTLLIEDALQVFNQTSKKLKLKHLDSAWTTLEQHLTADVFSDVDVAYRSELPEDIKSKLEQEAPRMKDLNELLPVFREYILDQLKERHTKPQESLKLCLSFLELEDGDSPSKLAAYRMLPDELLVAHALSAFLFLSAYEKNKHKL